MATPTPNVTEEQQRLYDDTVKRMYDEATNMDLGDPSDMDSRENKEILAATEPKVDEQRQAIIDSYDNYSSEFDKMITSAAIARQENKNASKEENRTNLQTSRFGAAAQAAAALANLIGTTQGAANQQWQSPVAGWQGRVDQIMREREAKIDAYNNQMQDLRLKRAALDAAKTEALTKYDQNKVTQQLAANKEAMDNYYKAQQIAAKQVEFNMKATKDYADVASKYAIAMRKAGYKLTPKQISEAMATFFPGYAKQEGPGASKSGGMADNVFGKKQQ